MNYKWEHLNNGHETLWLGGVDFYVSYNHGSSSSGIRPTTALIKNAHLPLIQRTAYILTGCFQREYDKAFPNWNKCRHIFNVKAETHQGKILIGAGKP